MKPLLFIVDDEQKYLDRFSGCLTGYSIDIRLAHSFSEAEELSEKYVPAAATIDFCISGDTGNEVGEMLKIAHPSVKLAGITSGSPLLFDDKIFDIRDHKSLSDESYQELVRCLLYSKNPREEYHAFKQKNKPNELVAAAYILVQGYVFARNLQKGIVPAELAHVKFSIPSEEEIQATLDFSACGINIDAVHAALVEHDSNTADDGALNNFFADLKQKKRTCTLEDAQHVEELFREYFQKNENKS